MSVLIKARANSGRHVPSAALITAQVADQRHLPSRAEILVGLVKAGAELVVRITAHCLSFEAVGGDPDKWRR